MTDITITLNGEVRQLPAGSTLADALAASSQPAQSFASAINGEFVPRSTYAERELLSGDQIDIVKPVGGG